MLWSYNLIFSLLILTFFFLLFTYTRDFFFSRNYHLKKLFPNHTFRSLCLMNSHPSSKKLKKNTLANLFSHHLTSQDDHLDSQDFFQWQSPYSDLTTPTLKLILINFILSGIYHSKKLEYRCSEIFEIFIVLKKKKHNSNFTKSQKLHFLEISILSLPNSAKTRSECGCWGHYSPILTTTQSIDIQKKNNWKQILWQISFLTISRLKTTISIPKTFFSDKVPIQTSIPQHSNSF